MHALPQVQDPRARSSLVAVNAYVSGLRADYRRASDLISLARAEIDAFDLEFARPHANWSLAFIELGLRHFGAADRALRLVEDDVQQKPLGYHVLNARVLRARLALQTGQTEIALELVRRPDVEAAIPSIHGEYLATRALVLAVTGEESAAEAASAAQQTSSAVEVQALALAALATLSALRGSEALLRPFGILPAKPESGTQSCLRFGRRANSAILRRRTTRCGPVYRRSMSDQQISVWRDAPAYGLKPPEIHATS